jgi:hypothetical protein
MAANSSAPAVKDAGLTFLENPHFPKKPGEVSGSIRVSPALVFPSLIVC